MPDYKQGKIYSLRSHQTDQVYIGSTIQPLYKRLFSHKQSYKCWMKGTHYYVSSFEIVKYGDAYVELVEEYPCENKMQLDKREGEIIRTTEKCVNKRVAGRTNKEYCEENKVRVAQKKREWREANKVHIAQKRKEWGEANKFRVAQQMKEYYQEKKDHISQQKKEYYLKNIETKKRYGRLYRCKRNPIGLAIFGI